MTPDVVERLVAAGCECHGVRTEDAEAAVREAASAAGMRFVSQQRAVDHVARQVSEKMAGSAVLYPTDRQRILAEGAHWGLSPQDVEAIISDQVEINRRELAARRKRAGIVAAAVGAAAFALACVVLGSTLLRDREPTAEVAGGSSDSSESGDGDSRSSAPSPDAWWDVDLSVAMSRAEVELPYVRPGLSKVHSYTPSVRGEAYGQIVAGLPRALESRTAMAVLREIVSGAYALEPSDAPAGSLRDRLFARLPDPKSATPADVRSMKEAFAAVDLAVAAATREGISDTRADEMRRGLGQALGFTPDPTWRAEELGRESAAALVRLYYRVAVAAAPAHPNAVQPMHDFLSAEADRHLDPTAVARLDAEFLRTLLPVDESVWRQYQEPILRVVAAEDPNVVLLGVDLLEEVRDESLRFYLAMGLLRRIGLAPQSQSPEQVASAVRQEFGASARSTRTAEDGWRDFSGEAEELLGRLSPTTAPSLSLLEETANLARLSAMGCALAKGELGRASFEQIKEMAAIDLEQRSGDSSSSSLPESSTARSRMVSRHIDSLSRATHPVQRIGYLKAIAESSSQIQEIEPQEGEVIAKYLLSPMGDEEREALAGIVPRVGRWKMVRLAAADLIAATPVREDLVQEVVARMLGEEPEEAGQVNWRERARLKLMRSVLTGGIVGSSFGHPFDTAQQVILSMYQMQARAEGVSASSSSGAASPTEVLPAMIEQLASRLAAKTRSNEDREFLERIPHELAVAEYLGENDLRRLALLERIWLRLVAMDVVHARSDRAEDVQKIVEQLSQSDQGAKDVFHQLRDGQAALVRLWLLRMP
jgi:hypothetical protein